MNVDLESALRLRQYPGAVSWLQAAVAKFDPGKKVSKRSGLGIHREPLFICNLPFQRTRAKKALRRAMDEHDDLISGGRNIDLMKITIQPKPFQLDLPRPSVEIQRMAKVHQEFSAIEKFAAEHMDENLYARDFTKAESNSSIEGMASVQNQGLVNRVMATGMQERRHLLCQGRKMAPHLQCLSLHHMDSYLRLGPFHLEVLALQPFVGVLRGVYSNSQLREVREVSSF